MNDKTKKYVEMGVVLRFALSGCGWVGWVVIQERNDVFFEPTDRRKAVKPLKSHLTLSYSSPNLNELRAMANFLTPNISPIKNKNDLDEVLELAKIVSKAVDFLLVTLGEKGVLTFKNVKESQIVRFYPAKVIQNVKNVSGAGDCFTSGFITGILADYKDSVNVSIGYQSAKQALLCKNTVPTDLRFEKISKMEAEYEPIKIN